MAPDFTVTPRQFFEPDETPSGPAVKLHVPFEMTTRSGKPTARTVAQDSAQEIAQCVFAVLATELGQRLEAPEFGIEPLDFSRGADLDAIRAAIEEHEPRARALTEEQFDHLVSLVKVSLV